MTVGFRLIPGVGLLAVLLVAGGCRGGVDRHQAEFLVFGTRVEVIVRGVEDHRAEQAFARLGRDFQRMHREWHPWAPGPLVELNQGLVAGGWVRTTPDLVALIKASQDMETRSGGLFNAAIGPLVGLWGFHTSEYPITDPPPTADAIAGLLAWRPSALDIHIDGQRVHSGNRAVGLDFSGIAKGFAAAAACDRLADFQIIDALVNLGGDVMVCADTSTPWQVAVRDPAGGVLTTLAISQRQAVFTSGNYHRYGQWDGQRYAHILDPASGYPVEAVMQATVIDPDPILADAAATALVVAGPETWRLVADQMGVERALIVDSAGNIQASDALAETIRK
jgi:FAD:protein FMN transferase